ncbi:1,4-dihydroxy-2-naphthoate octaprenyltransferase [Sphaerotilus hippei]|uniref:1,4-dihydroxy-2-naphthoate octaprenyltransferase n=1 Tax=Sphaerotilus hippei TaxID=744406 RepID=A0A318GVG4_9BURK|nr:1,4-dihydroxy-2-naphthoate octaprenyltransferase [Sphaerotilus hippei]
MGRWVVASRPGFLVVTLGAVLTGIGSAAACGVVIDRPAALATVVLALLAHAAVNLHNDWGDALIGSDAANTERIGPFTGGSRVVQDGVFSAAQLRDMVQMLGMVVVGGGLLLTARAGPGLLAIGLAGLALGWAYSHPRLALMSRGVGELAVAAGWWLVVIGADYVQRRHFDAAPALAGVSLALLIAAMLWVAEFPDARSDAQVGKRTLVVRLGPVRAAWGHLVLVLSAHAWLAGWWLALWLPTTAWWALGSAPLSLVAAIGLIVRARQPRRLRPVIVLTLGAVVLHAALLIAAFVSVMRQR